VIDMSILSWILLGLIAGFLGSKIVNRHGEAIFLDIVLGIVGALAGGCLSSLFWAARVADLNLYSVLVATLGAILVLVVCHGIRRITVHYSSEAMLAAGPTGCGATAMNSFWKEKIYMSKESLQKAAEFHSTSDEVVLGEGPDPSPKNEARES
jgi:uncharacterized membrane protein YeaQ/YmgE (transglycosylase-associated protein family)